MLEPVGSADPDKARRRPNARHPPVQQRPPPGQKIPCASISCSCPLSSLRPAVAAFQFPLAPETLTTFALFPSLVSNEGFKLRRCHRLGIAAEIVHARFDLRVG